MSQQCQSSRWAATTSAIRLTTSFSLAAMVSMSSGCSATRSASASLYDNIPGDAYAIVAEVRAKPGKENELRAATLPLVEQVRREPNNLLYFLHEDRESPGHFIFYENFASQHDFENHNITPHVTAWFSKLPALADGDVKVTRMKALGN